MVSCGTKDFLKWNGLYFVLFHFTKKKLYKIIQLPNFLQNRMKLKTLSLANQVPGWTLNRQGNSLSGTSKSGDLCLVLPSAIRSSKSSHFCRTALPCCKEKRIIFYLHLYLSSHFGKKKKIWEKWTFGLTLCELWIWV